MNDEARAIEDFFRRRYGREALFVPSGRLALYLAFGEWLRPGDRLLMSPVNDDVVFFTVLAAGLEPVLGPVNPRTGNLDPTAIDDSTWAGLKGVMTTNLYGTPDRMDVLQEKAREHGLILLEDACHALDTSFNGRRIGTFGTAAAYSLSKHLHIAGGVLSFSDPTRRPVLAQRALSQLRSGLFSASGISKFAALLETTGIRDRTPPWLARLGHRVAPRGQRGSGHRMRFAAADVARALREGGGLDAFDRWVRQDNPAYRTWPLRASLREARKRLESFEENRRARLEGARALLDLGYTPADMAIPRDAALLRVPLFVQDRERVIARLEQRGLRTEYVYDPPLDLYAPGLAQRLPSPPTARIWSRDVLPVNPLLAGRFIALTREMQDLCTPIAD
ncbi:MAG TPA: DegT/DnrJ/EryC1/StrS family aminotransferase [Thermoplasmata archaeon]|nr:DegT/DnrJ/EryC1/StrS family aminotransferase [Thermoplasmata archaeon]